MPTPTCRKCSTQHYGFQDCEEVARKRAAEAAKPRVHVEWRNDGDREWHGNRTSSYDIRGNTYWRKHDG